MGRRAFSSPRKRVNIYLDESLLLEFQSLHFDPIRGKSEYGQLTEMFNNMLRAYLLEKRKEKAYGGGRPD
jgi:hypothetical protein